MSQPLIGCTGCSAGSGLVQMLLGPGRRRGLTKERRDFSTSCHQPATHTHTQTHTHTHIHTRSHTHTKSHIDTQQATTFNKTHHFSPRTSDSYLCLHRFKKVWLRLT